MQIRKFQDMVFGVPKEILSDERRVAATPETVKKLIDEGAEVLVEASAGQGAFFEDEQYRTAGAKLVSEVEELYDRSNIILKVKEPKFHEGLGKHEVEMMKAGQYLVAFLHPASPRNHTMIKKLADQGVTALTLDGIPRISRAQSMDALTSMSTVAGYKGFLLAANRLPKFIPMLGTAAGLIKPATVVVIGAGVCGLQAIATAKRLGATVYATDIRPDACEQAKSLGAKLIDLKIPAEVAVGNGGYANKLPEEWLSQERAELKEYVIKADIVILSALIPNKQAPLLVTDDMVKSMGAGSVIVDISVDQGGNCQLTECGKILNKYGVIIDGTPNIPGTVPISSTAMFAKNVLNFVSYLVEEGKVGLKIEDEIIATSLVTKDGEIVHHGTLEAMKIN